MRISDWSSDVCSSDLHAFGRASRRRAGSESARTAAFSGFPPESLSWDLKIKFAVPYAGCHDCLYPFLELRKPADRRLAGRSEECRVGKECVSRWRYRW